MAKAWRHPVVTIGLVVGIGGALAGGVAFAVSAAQAPHGPVPGPDATLTSTAHTYMEAAKHNDCGMTRALTTSNTTAWCDAPRLLSYAFVGRTGDDGACMEYSITTDTGLDGTDQGGPRNWGFCYRLTKEGWRLWDQGQG